MLYVVILSSDYVSHTNNEEHTDRIDRIYTENTQLKGLFCANGVGFILIICLSCHMPAPPT